MPRGNKVTHGKTGTPEFVAWVEMLKRCNNPNCESWKYYGGCGITVCERWNKFENFLTDVGLKPSSKHSLDRIDPHGNYEPNNVRWATVLEQATNKRNTRFVVYRGSVMALTEAVRRAGAIIHYEAAAGRIKWGWTVEDAVETPRLFESPNSRSRRQRAQNEAAQ